MVECFFYELSGCAFEPRCSDQTVGNSDQVNLLNITEIICQFISRLPGLFHDRWNRNTKEFRRRYERKLQLTDLVNFFEDEMTLENGPLHFRDAVSQIIDNVKASNSTWTINSFATKKSKLIILIIISRVKRKISYVLCNEDHVIE